MLMYFVKYLFFNVTVTPEECLHALDPVKWRTLEEIIAELEILKRGKLRAYEVNVPLEKLVEQGVVERKLTPKMPPVLYYRSKGDRTPRKPRPERKIRWWRLLPQPA